MNAFTKRALAAAVTFSGATTVATTASAIEIRNCTGAHLPVLITHPNSGRTCGSKTLGYQQTGVWNTGRSGGIRISINVPGPDKRFSNWKGNESLSIRTIAGNTELSHGDYCPEKAEVTPPTPQPGGGNIDVGDAVAG